MNRARVKRVGSPIAAVEEPVMPLDDAPVMTQQDEVTVPADWRKGALLNVRNYGDAYVITLYPEEWDQDRPERAMRFTNLGECQDFVSKWYAAEHHDPRAR